MSKILWALFGNDEDGIYGTEKWRDERGLTDHAVWTAIRWQIRNPLHNLFWHVLNWPNDDPDIWPAEGHLIKFRMRPPFFSFRYRLEGYIGFRGKQGVFGMALRIAKATGA